MTAEEAKAILDDLPEEEREKVRLQQEKMRKGMEDLAHLVTALKPSSTEPDAVVTQVKLVRALATCPAMALLGTDAQQLLGPTIEYLPAKEALSKVEDKLEEIGALQKDELNDIENELHWRNAVLIYWHLHRSAHEDFAATLPGEVDHFRQGANQVGTKLLIQAQMLMPQQRWVQPTLAVAKLSALMANALWSHTDPAALEKMHSIITEDGLPVPKLTLTAKAQPRESTGNEVVSGQQVHVSADLTRGHAADGDTVAAPPCNNPQGIYEAYWFYVEGLKPEGTPNSLIVAKPLVVTDLKTKVVTGEAVFTAPPVPGEYSLRIHITSTSVIGIELSAEVTFVVVEDDIPALE